MILGFILDPVSSIILFQSTFHRHVYGLCWVRNPVRLRHADHFAHSQNVGYVTSLARWREAGILSYTI
jgi:hypothetical protein